MSANLLGKQKQNLNRGKQTKQNETTEPRADPIRISRAADRNVIVNMHIISIWNAYIIAALGSCLSNSDFICDPLVKANDALKAKYT